MRNPVVLCLAALLGALAVAQAASNEQIRKTGEAWLALVDYQKYPDSWNGASSYFRSQVPQARWVEMAQHARTPLGRLTSRKFVRIAFKKSPPGAPDGNYAVLQFESSFQNKAKAVETVTLMLDHGQWKTAGYFIK